MEPWNQKANPMKLRAIYQNSWLQINSLTLNNLFHLLTQTLLKLLSVLSYLLQCPTVCEALLDSPLRLQIAVFLHMLLFSSSKNVLRSFATWLLVTFCRKETVACSPMTLSGHTSVSKPEDPLKTVSSIPC